MNERALLMTREAAPRAAKGARRLRPRDSASIAVIEKSGGRWHVLMGVRHSKHAFYPDALAFPGGAVDPRDWAVPLAAGPTPETARLIGLRPRRPVSPARTVAIAAAAVRETFEEAGMLIGGPVPAGAKAPPDWQGFLDRGLAPDLSMLRLFMRAITPPGRARRFDNRFFAVERAHVAECLPAEACPTAELGDRRFLPIEEAMGMEMPRVTRVALRELLDRLDGPGGLDAATPVPFYHMVRGQFICEPLG